MPIHADLFRAHPARWPGLSLKSSSQNPVGYNNSDSTSSACPQGQPTQSEIQVKGKELSSQRAPGPDNPGAPFSRLCLFGRHVEFPFREGERMLELISGGR